MPKVCGRANKYGAAVIFFALSTTQVHYQKGLRTQDATDRASTGRTCEYATFITGRYDVAFEGATV